jgi:hypothetical protein
MSEHDEQSALFQWAETMVTTGRIPELENLFAIPNGAWMKSYTIARKMIEEGMKKGVPDVFLACPSPCGDHGLFIEMKFGKNKPTQDQNEWSDRLRNREYYYYVCWSWVEAAGRILDYLGKDRGKYL